jgi:hypothetical protein
MTKAVQALAACALFGVLATPVHAQEQDRYPWDQRPKKCFMEGAFTGGVCAPPDNYPSAGMTHHNLMRLYYGDKFRLLERYLSDLVASGKRFEDGLFPEEVLMRSLSMLMTLGSEYAKAEERNAAWRREIPDSKFVVYAEAARLHGAAWRARGTGYANTVSPESWELFALRVRDAEQVLLDAPRFYRESPAWHLALLGIAMESSGARSDPREVFSAAVKRWPAYAMFYQKVVERMIPKWGGSWEEVEAFIARSTATQPPSEGKALYARLYIGLLPERPDDLSSINWETMKSGLRDAADRFTDPKYRNLYASYSCLNRDKEAFAQAMRLLPREQIQDFWWLRGNSYEACLRWAGV